MASPIPQLKQFLYSHYFLGGLRQSIGVLLPVIILGRFFGHYDIGVIASMGATCVAIIDQPGGPRRYRNNEMLGGIALGTLTVALTGLASSEPLLLVLCVPLLCFLYSMFSVFGRRGGLIGFAALLLMTLTMRFPMQPQEVLAHTLYSFFGGLSYYLFSTLFRRLLWYREERQTLAVALFATAQYMEARAQFYDPGSDLDDCYRRLINLQSDMTDKHQAARDMVLRELPRGHGRGDYHRRALLTIFLNMVSILDSLVATYTDYTVLRRQVADSDFMVFARDGLHKLSLDIGRIAMNVSRSSSTRRRASVKAEIRAMEYELEHYRRQGMPEKDPETYALLVQVLRRLRNLNRIVDHMAGQTHRASQNLPVDQYLNKSLSRFLSREDVRLGMLTSNLKLKSSHFRYAARVSIASMIALGVGSLSSHFEAQLGLVSALTAHSYWIILTILVIMKPGFATTRQRNGWRLFGTVLGCAAAFVLFKLTDNREIYLAAMLLAYLLGNSLVQLNFMLSALFNTIFVILSFQFLSTGGSFIIGERLVDTLIGCAIAMAASYLLPSWEANAMTSLARAALAANQEFWHTGLEFARLSRLHNQGVKERQDSAPAQTDAQRDQLDLELMEADTAWQVANKNVHIAFSNFASAFYRMMDEPVSRQRNVSLLNNLLIQNHVLASQISAAVPLLANLTEVPPGIAQSLQAIGALIQDQDAEPPASIETEGDLAMLAYPIRQMSKAAQLIRQDMRGLEYEAGPQLPTEHKSAAGQSTA
ncbi:MAG TPA: FUSC family membrane protein [Alcaligenes faecalis]|nr:FUSC family membrane protein [Alcaligenes faecalis]